MQKFKSVLDFFFNYFKNLSSKIKYMLFQNSDILQRDLYLPPLHEPKSKSNTTPAKQPSSECESTDPKRAKKGSSPEAENKDKPGNALVAEEE